MASNISTYDPITDGSEATPGLWNLRFEQQQKNIVSLNSSALDPSASVVSFAGRIYVNDKVAVNNGGTFGSDVAVTGGNITSNQKTGVSDLAQTYVHSSGISHLGDTAESARIDFTGGSIYGPTVSQEILYSVAGPTEDGYQIGMWERDGLRARNVRVLGGSAATPGLSFQGSGSTWRSAASFDAGLYLSNWDAINGGVVTWAHNGTATFQHSEQWIRGSHSSSPALSTLTGATLNINILPARGDPDTGIAHPWANGEDEISVFAGSQEVLRGFKSGITARMALSPGHRTGGDKPASGTASGITGQVSWTTRHLYICTSADSWRRVAIANF